MTKLSELADVIRSKNAGPFELTFDIIFDDAKTFERVKNSGALTKELISKLYSIPLDDILTLLEYDAACAIKITIVRPLPSGGINDTDIMGCQQHAPLLNIEIP